MLIVRLKFVSTCSANAKKYLAYTQRKLKIIPFLKFLQMMLRVHLSILSLRRAYAKKY
jgi:hypothetical protein